jgi:hypothetical protein
MNSHLQNTKQVRQFKSQQQRLKMKKSFTLPLADAAGKKQSDITFLTLWIRAQKNIHHRITKKF